MKEVIFTIFGVIIMILFNLVIQRRLNKARILGETNREYGLVDNELFFKTMNYLTSFKEDKTKIVILAISFNINSEGLGKREKEILIKEAITILRGILRTTDYITRYGEGYIVYLPRIRQIKDIDNLMDRIISEYRKPVILNKVINHIDINIGIAVFPDDETNIDLLISRSEYARTKSEKYNVSFYCYYNKGLNLKYNKKGKLIKEINKGLKNREFILNYQPQYSFSKREVIGVESLVRWVHPKKGYLTPDKFIPLTESLGLTSEFGNYILEESFKTLKEIHDKGYRIKISINISPNQLLSRDFKRGIKTLLSKYKVDPSFVVLEVTETSLVDTNEETITIINELKKIGLKIALDDFGVGYSNITSVSKLPIDIVKIDRSFVKDLDKNDINSEILRSVISLIKHQGNSIVIEGVETKEQLDFVIKEGCDIIQGYYYSKPLSLNGLYEYLRRVKDVN